MSLGSFLFLKEQIKDIIISGPGAARTILLFHIISTRPPKQPLFFSSRGLGRRMLLGVEVTESSTKKQHHLSIYCEMVNSDMCKYCVQADMCKSCV